MRILIASSLVALIAVANSKAEFFEFDLTDAVGTEFLSFPESAVDLNYQFSSITSAQIHIIGAFTPGLMTPASIPPNTGPILPTDTVNLLIRLGEIGTAWIDKPAYAIQSLQGYQGAVEFHLPLLGSMVSGEPVFFPSGGLAPSYDFLLDGRFGLAAVSGHTVVVLYQVLESPRFELERFVLQIEGTSIPEPQTCFVLVIALASAVLCRAITRPAHMSS